MLSNEIVDVNIISNNETGKIEIIEKPINEKKEDEYVTPKDYLMNSDIINTLKLPDLKKTLKFYKNSMIIPNHTNTHIKKAKAAIKHMHDFALVGNKKIIQERLKYYFEQERLAIRIQKITRGFFVRKMISLIGPAINDHSLCINDSDFNTLEPLKEIDIFDFYSYKDSQGKIYGFQLSSLLTLIKKRKHKTLENPFNREKINYLITPVKRLNNLNKIIQTKYIPGERKLYKINVKPRAPVKPTGIRNQQNGVTRMQEMLLTEYNYEYDTMLNFIRNTRSKTISERSILLFVEIDQLGNYSNNEWFTNLDRRGYLRYFRILRDIWIYRAQIPSTIKFKICPLWDPFLILSDVNGLNDLSIEQLQSLCLSVMEDMVYTGVDTEFKTLGAIHALSVLTLVSHEARIALPWLYESLI